MYKLHRDGYYRDELYFILAYTTALRVSDLRMLKWEDVLNRTCLVVTEKKTGKTRPIPFNDEFRKIVSELYDLLGHPYKGWYILKGTNNNP